MTQVSGQVTEIKERTTKFGPMYDLVVNGKPYGHGKFAPRGIKQGDFVTFDVEVKQNGQWTNYNIVNKSLRVDEAPSPEVRKQAVAETAANLSAADKKQEIISRQSATNSALTLIGLQLQYGGIKFPASAKAADVYALIDAAVLDQAQRLFKLNTGDEWLISQEDITPVTKPKAGGSAPVKDTAPAANDEGFDEFPE